MAWEFEDIQRVAPEDSLLDEIVGVRSKEPDHLVRYQDGSTPYVLQQVQAHQQRVQQRKQQASGALTPQMMQQTMQQLTKQGVQPRKWVVPNHVAQSLAQTQTAQNVLKQQQDKRNAYTQYLMNKARGR